MTDPTTEQSEVSEVPDTSEPDATSTSADPAPLDLDAVERDLAAVETALQRLSDGTYWTDEVTGEPIPEHVLATEPTARRA